MLLSAVFGFAAVAHVNAGAAPGSTQAPQPLRAPDAVAAEFYGWYLDALFADQDPLSDRYDRFTAYVAQDLTKRLVECLQKTPTAPTDYFLQASAWQPAWRHGVHAALLRRERASAEVLVTLSGDGAPTQALLLGMRLEHGAWKIQRVQSSAGQPVI